MFTIEDRVQRVMVLVMLADGEIGDDEVATIQREMGRIAGVAPSAQRVRREAAEAREDGASVAAYLRALGRSLDDEERATILKAACAVAGSDGFVRDEEAGVLHEVAAALGFSGDQVAALISGGQEP